MGHQLENAGWLHQAGLHAPPLIHQNYLHQSYLIQIIPEDTEKSKWKQGQASREGVLPLFINHALPHSGRWNGGTLPERLIDRRRGVGLTADTASAFHRSSKTGPSSFCVHTASSLVGHVNMYAKNTVEPDEFSTTQPAPQAVLRRIFIRVFSTPNFHAKMIFRQRKVVALWARFSLTKTSIATDEQTKRTLIW
jgi:hypothetical protein